MDKESEKLYLMDLLLEASRWKVSEGEPLPGLELEVRDRLRRLFGIDTMDVDGSVHSDIPEYAKQMMSARASEKKEERNSLRVKFPDGSWHRVATEDTHTVPMNGSPTGYKHVINEDRLAYYLEKYKISCP